MSEVLKGADAVVAARQNSVQGGTFESTETRGDLIRIKAKELAAANVKGEILVGRYEGTLPNKFNVDSPDFKFRLENDTLAIVTSCGSLKNGMKNIAPGTLVQLIFNGASPMKSGPAKGKIAYSYTVNTAENAE